MKVGYSEKCTICNSEHRAIVEKWAAEEGLSPRVIATKLNDEYGFEVGYKAIWRHLKNHFNVDAEAAERYGDNPDFKPPEPGSEAETQYRKSRGYMDEAANKRIKDINRLDEVAEINFKLHKETDKKLRDLMAAAKKNKNKRPDIPKTLVDLHSNTASEMRQALKAKMDILKVDTPEKNSDAIRATLVDLILGLDD